MYVINLFGGPGVGKSSGSAYIFSQLKFLNQKVELITEFAKDKTWENNNTALSNQVYIFGEQYYRMSRCQDKVDILVTDCPLILSAIYNKSEILGKGFNDVVVNVFKSYKNFNYTLKRVKPYMTIGRNETEEQAKDIDINVRNMLDSYDIEYTEVMGNAIGYDYIITDVLRRIK